MISLEGSTKGTTKKGTPNREQNGANKEQNWGKKGPKLGLFGVLSFMKIPLVSPSLDQKEQIYFGHPQFYSSIAPMGSTAT